jgi:uncharacterized protein YhaN
MIPKIIIFVRNLISSAERDRLQEKFEKVHEKFDHFDERLDALEISQALQNEKLSSIKEITLANNEALEQKLNRSAVTAHSVREIVDFRIESFQESLKRLEGLISELLLRSGKSD